jgi:hypothetical protein
MLIVMSLVLVSGAVDVTLFGDEEVGLQILDFSWSGGRVTSFNPPKETC